MSNLIVSVKDLTKTFTQGKEKLTILDKVSLDIEQGNVISLVGESGCGKSTFLQIIGGLIKFDSGSLDVLGTKLENAKDSEKTELRKNKIGFIYQQHYLLSDFSAIENIMLACKVAGKSSTEAKNKATELLDQLGLQDRANHRPAELSGGQQQRVAIARSFANNPSLILADEPTGNLDEKNASIVLDLFLNMSKENNATLVIATHNKEISQKTNKVYEISGGHIHVE